MSHHSTPSDTVVSNTFQHIQHRSNSTTCQYLRLDSTLHRIDNTEVVAQLINGIGANAAKLHSVDSLVSAYPFLLALMPLDPLLV